MVREGEVDWGIVGVCGWLRGEVGFCSILGERKEKAPLWVPGKGVSEWGLGVQEGIEVGFGEDGEGGVFFGVIEFGAGVIAGEEVGCFFGDGGAYFAASVFDEGFEVAAFGGEGAGDDEGEAGELL